MRCSVFSPPLQSGKVTSRLPHDRDKCSDKGSLFFLQLVQVPAHRCEQGKLGETLHGWFKLDTRPSSHVEQRSPLAGSPGSGIAPEAGTLPPVLAPISKEEGGPAALPTYDSSQLCLCVEGPNRNRLA